MITSKEFFKSMEKAIDRVNPEGITIKLKTTEAIDLKALLISLKTYRPELYSEIIAADKIIKQVESQIL